MKVITEHVLIKEVAETWKNHYFRDGHWEHYKSWEGEQPRTIYRKLCELPKDATAAQVELIIGNRSWTNFYCMECGEEIHQEAVIEFGTHIFGDDQWHICLKCLKEAVLKLKIVLEMTV